MSKLLIADWEDPGVILGIIEVDDKDISRDDVRDKVSEIIDQLNEKMELNNYQEMHWSVEDIIAELPVDWKFIELDDDSIYLI